MTPNSLDLQRLWADFWHKTDPIHGIFMGKTFYSNFITSAGSLLSFRRNVSLNSKIFLTELSFIVTNLKKIFQWTWFSIREHPLMTSSVFWPFLTYLLTLSYSLTSDFGGYLGPTLSDVINGRSLMEFLLWYVKNSKLVRFFCH